MAGGEHDPQATMPDYIRAAHKFCTRNQKMIADSGVCGCFYCLAQFQPIEMKKWIPYDGADTALCQLCGIDSVIGDACGLPLTPAFLAEMHAHWFAFEKP